MVCLCYAEKFVSRLLWAFVLCWISLFLSSIQAQQDLKQSSTDVKPSRDTKSEDVLELHQIATIGHQAGTHVNYAELKLGSLEAGKKYRLHVKMLNPADTPIAFSRVELDCTCMKFETEVNEIPAHGFADFIIWLDAPQKAGEARVYSGAKFVDRETRETVLKLSVRYELNNMFNLKARQLVIEFPDNETAVAAKIPVQIVKPLTLEQLEMEVSDSLRDLAISTEAVEDGAMINIIATRPIIANGSISGEVTLRRVGTSDTATVAVVVRQQQALSVSPESIRLTSIEGRDSYSSNAMLRVRHSLEEGEAKPESPLIELWIGGRQAEVETTPVGKSGIFRLKIRVKGPLEPESDGSLPAKWLLRSNGVERVIETYGFLF